MTKKILISFFIVLAVWAIFTWPLPRHVDTGITSSSRNVEKGQVRAMIPGDHLQLLYQFWLFNDMLAGHSRWFYNLYEFNTGDDAARYRPVAYFLPFSLFYTAGNWLDGQAFGWNLAVFISLWLSYLFTWLLVRRYAPSNLVAGGLALLSLLLPYRWLTLLGGSPTGLSMMWVPLILLGLDLAVRQERWAGGLLAGLSILLSSLGDMHVLYFSLLLAPAWCLLALLQKPDFPWRALRSYGRIILALAPAAALLLPAALYSVMRASHLDESKIAAGRSLHELALYSPRPAGLFSWHDMGEHSQIFIGYGMVALICLGALNLALGGLRRDPGRFRRLLSILLLTTAIVAVILLALGPYGPFEGKTLWLARRLIPGYRMMRQTSKIFCLMPTLLAVVGAVALGSRPAGGSRPRWQTVTLLLLAGLILAEHRQHVQATVCLLDRGQDAYRAVAEDSRSQGREPRVLILPLWPGDAAWASLYEYYVSLYRIRMANGYSPVIRTTYYDEFFLPFESGNQGLFSDEQLNELQRRGIDYVLLHEDAFPEKVSPFAVGITLKRLLNHPRLQLLHQQESVWAFRILSEGQDRRELGGTWNFYFPARLREAEENRDDNSVFHSDGEAGGDGYVTLAGTNAGIEIRSAYAGDTTALRWMIRGRGPGGLSARTWIDEKPASDNQVDVPSDSWRWLEIPIPTLPRPARVELRLAGQAGSVDVDQAILAAGAWNPPSPGQSMEIPAPCFFHAGYTDLTRDSVVLRKDRDSHYPVFYGPKLPLDPGSYQVEMIFSSGAGAGTPLGRFNIRYSEQADEGEAPVIAGQPAQCQLELKRNLPVYLTFYFLRKEDIEIHSVIFHRRH